MNVAEDKVVARDDDVAAPHSLDVLAHGSTGICFIGERHFREFLQNYFPATKGDVVDIESGKVIGHHIGVLYYTLGQRHEPFNGNIIVGYDTSGAETLECSNNDTKLKDSAWFKAHRTTPAAWA